MPNDMRPERSERLSERELWRQSQGAEAPFAESEGFLDLAGFAEGRLDADDNERIEAILHAGSEAASDVAAARNLSRRDPPVASEDIISRACALVAPAAPRTAEVLMFPRWRRVLPSVPPVAQWASLAAALVLASWLGFAMGSDTWAAFGAPAQASDDGFMHEFLDPSIGFMREVTEGRQT